MINEHFLHLTNLSSEFFNLAKDNEDIIMATVKQCGWGLKFASNRLKENKELVLVAVAQDGDALKYASEKLRDDKEVVLKAIENSPHSLRYCSDRLKDNEYVIFAAIADIPSAFKHASKRLQNDKEFILNVIKNYGKSKYIEFSSRQIQVLCQGQDPIETLTKAIESEKLHAQLQQELSLSTSSQAIPKKPKKL